MRLRGKLSYSFPSLFQVSQNWYLTFLMNLYWLYQLGRNIRHKDSMNIR